MGRAGPNPDEVQEKEKGCCYLPFGWLVSLFPTLCAFQTHFVESDCEIVKARTSSMILLFVDGKTKIQGDQESSSRCRIRK